MHKTWFIAVAALVTAAGCVAPIGTSDVEGATAVPALPVTVPTAIVDAEATLLALQDFINAYPQRQRNMLSHAASRDALDAMFTAAGLTTLRDPLPDAEHENVCAVIEGAAPLDLVIVGGHFDTVPSAVQGAYDNAAGTMMVMELARAFAAISADDPPARTIVFCAFDGEERGLFGSQHVAKALAGGSWLIPGDAFAMMNLDVVGIAWPAPYPLVVTADTSELIDLSKVVAADVGFPDDQVVFDESDVGGSDHQSFMAAGVPVISPYGGFDGICTRAACGPGFYPFWHAADTYAGMITIADGEANLIDGYQNSMDFAAGVLAKLAWDPTFAFADA